MSSNFFQLAQNIINDLVDCLPPDYDSIDEVGSINIEYSCDLQRLSEKILQSNDNTSYKKTCKDNNPSDEIDVDINSQSNSNFSNVSNNTCHDELRQNTEIQQICEIRITTPGWLRNAKSEFRETQDKRDVMGSHVLAIARAKECNRALRRMNISNDNSEDKIKVPQNNVKTTNATLISGREEHHSFELSTNIDGDGKTSPLFSGGSDGSLSFKDSLIFEGKSSINIGEQLFLPQPIGGNMRSTLKMNYKYFLKNGNDEEELSESISTGSLSDQHKYSGDVDNYFMQAANFDEYETEYEEEEVILTSQQELFQQLTRDNVKQQGEDFNNNFTCARRSYKNDPNENDVILLEYETECEEEEVILTSQQELFQQTMKVNVTQQHEFFKNNPNDKDKYLNFITGLNNSSSNNNDCEGLNDTCDYFEEEEWETMLIGQTAAYSLKENGSKENDMQRTFQIMSNGNI
ncbi:19275_t:CDS:2 [Funneliformis geosporum]|uniref:16045_t:CDS:1 n=1 Tax=Funneliformis geosporum TaxID=1117311 RepID=A0A9W4WRF6_9GLOM|nr:19275_t:CDS:2 [Funneliformis geosporum]CAI2181078.1 16045_t:CDS:2 [Funneliformis geosporum]